MIAAHGKISYVNEADDSFRIHHEGCALCHTGGDRTRPDDAVARRYVNFLAEAAADPRFTPTTILAEISKNYRLSATDRLLYRLVIIPDTRKHLRALRDHGQIWDHGAMERLPAVERAQKYLKRAG